MSFANFRRNTSKLAQRYNLFLIFLLLVGLVLLKLSPTGLVHSFGEAVVIASLLGIFVDFYLKRRILREATLDISKFLLGYTLPEEVQNQISQLMQTTLLRRDFEVRYEITRKNEKCCKVSVDASYFLENFTSKPQPYTQELGFEKEEQAQITEFRLDSADNKAKYCVRVGSGLSISHKNDVLRAAGPKCMIEPKAWGSTYKFGYMYTIELPSSYPDILSFERLTSRVVVRIISSPDIEAVADMDSSCVVSPGRYEYKRVFLPAQHIRIRWKPKKPSS
jgi:hypothetical protein